MSSQSDPIQLILAEVRNVRDDLRTLGDEVQILKESRDTRPMLDRIYSEIADVKSSAAELKSDVSGMSSDISELKVDVSELKRDVADVKSDVAVLKVRMANVESRVKSVDKTFAQFVQYNLERQLDLDERVTRLEGRIS